MKVTQDQREIRWSKWIESLRKDVECTFGILKGRWRILKTGVRCHGVEACDKIWMTCCALHNWLLEIDGLDEQWGSEYEGDMGLHDQDDLSHMPPQIRAWLESRNLDPREFDVGGMGVGEDWDAGGRGGGSWSQGQQRIPPEHEGPVRVVRNLSLQFFRSKLVEHFDILWSQRRIVWPSRRGQQPAV
jgi:hypothetical protein